MTNSAKDTRERSNKIVMDAGGGTCGALPLLGLEGKTRSLKELIGRASVMSGMLRLHFEVPFPVIRDWIDSNDLSAYLSDREKGILSREVLSEQESIDLNWYIESLWALMWAGGLVEELPFDECADDRMAGMCPNPLSEDTSKFSKTMKVRGREEIRDMLDLYYCLHWYTEDRRINEEDAEGFDADIIMERRKALEWVFDKKLDWDDVPMDT
jgi:hypothetical protein